MKTKLKKILQEKYPTLYGGRTIDIDTLPIKSGLSVGDGWFYLIDVLSELIVENHSAAVAAQIKEKFGTLRFYLRKYPKQLGYVFGLTNIAQSLSEIICEECGKHGAMYCDDWVCVRCEEHKISDQYKKQTVNINGLPFDTDVIGVMRSEMISLLFRQIKMHVDHNSMPTVNFKKIENTDGKLSIEYSGGNDVTRGMVDLLVKYANNENSQSGLVLL